MFNKLKKLFISFKKEKSISDIAFDLYMKKYNMKTSYRNEKFYKLMFDLSKDRTDCYIEAKNIMRIKKLNKIKEKCLKKVI